MKRFKTESNYTPLTSNSSVHFTIISASTNSSAKELWAALILSSKKKATLALKKKNLPVSLKPHIWKDYGLKPSRDVLNHLQNKTNLALVIENLFQRTCVVRICPDMKKKTKNQSNSQELNQIHYGH